MTSPLRAEAPTFVPGRAGHADGAADDGQVAHGGQLMAPSSIVSIDASGGVSHAGETVGDGGLPSPRGLCLGTDGLVGGGGAAGDGQVAHGGELMAPSSFDASGGLPHAGDAVGDDGLPTPRGLCLGTESLVGDGGSAVGWLEVAATCDAPSVDGTPGGTTRLRADSLYLAPTLGSTPQTCAFDAAPAAVRQLAPTIAAAATACRLAPTS